MTNPHLSLDQKIVGDIYTSGESMENLSVLCDDYGSRFGGTEGERLAADFIKAKYEEYGLSNAHLEPFEYLGWERGEVKLEIISPIQKEIPCITLPHSPPVDMEGEIFPKKVKRWVHRQEKYGRSLMAGAIGFIFVNHYPGYGPATGGIGDYDSAGPIPGISITREDGAFIQRLAKRKGTVKIRLTSTDKLSKMTSWNVVGELPGTEKPEEIIMLGSHYDGHDISQGASDPASGVVAVMEAARVLAKYAGKLPRTIRFVMWGVEEIGLLGSYEYARAHADELENIRFYLNMDGAGGSPSKDINLHEWPSLQDTVEGYRKEMALDFAIGQAFHSASDHYPFLLRGVITAGIEAVQITRGGRGYGHTQYDTVDKVTLQGLQDAASLAARMALRVALEENWPASPRDAESVDKLLNQPDRSEIQAYLKRVKAFYKEIA